ncbi:MAG: hypothetical protein COA94_03070 [Rickettsiales bacterium]|nr:MAG: hypothetical protein COA94_03070 [Rickettsiales bacterium]
MAIFSPHTSIVQMSRREIARDYLKKGRVVYSKIHVPAGILEDSGKGLDAGIGRKPGVYDGSARYMKSAELRALNEELAKENARAIWKNPELVFEYLPLDNPVFTKEEIGAALLEALHKDLVIGEVADEKLIVGLEKNLARRCMVLEARIFSSDTLSLVTKCDLRGRALYTQTKRVELEERYTKTIKELHGRSNHSLYLQDVDLDHLSIREWLAKHARSGILRFTQKLEQKIGLKLNVASSKQRVLSPEQRKAVVGILNGKDLSLLQGLPGSGKTMLAGVIARQYKKAGKKVIGITPSDAAALALAKETGIECRNAILWRKIWLDEKWRGRYGEFQPGLRMDYYKEDKFQSKISNLTKNHVVIMDESSRMDLINMDFILSEVRKAGAKIIMLGDNN